MSLNTYLKSNYNTLLEMAKTITKNRYPDYEELCHITCVIVLEADRARMDDLIEKKAMRYWCARVMMNQYNSKTSPYHYTYRKQIYSNHRAAETVKEWHEPKTEEEWSDLMSKESLHKFVDEELSKVDYFERMCTLIYYEHEHSLNTLAKQTGISRTTLYKSIKHTRDAIKENYQEAKEETDDRIRGRRGESD